MRRWIKNDWGYSTRWYGVKLKNPQVKTRDWNNWKRNWCNIKNTYKRCFVISVTWKLLRKFCFCYGIATILTKVIRLQTFFMTVTHSSGINFSSFQSWFMANRTPSIIHTQIQINVTCSKNKLKFSDILRELYLIFQHSWSFFM